MTTEKIIQEVDKLPLKDKLFVIEQILKRIRLEKEQRLNAAVELLYDDYKNDKELTVFTALDNEPFYEAR